MSIELQPHQQRVIEERDALEEKITKLREFFGSKIYRELDRDDRALLSLQYNVMLEYADILERRIGRFGK